MTVKQGVFFWWHNLAFELNIWSQPCTFHLKNVFVLNESRVANILKKKLIIFSAILKPVLKFLSHNRMPSCIFSTVHRTVFSQCIIMHTIICLYLSQQCIAPSLCSGFILNDVNSMLMAWLLLSDGAELPPWWCRAGDSHSASSAGPHTACGLQFGHAWPKGWSLTDRSIHLSIQPTEVRDEITLACVCDTSTIHIEPKMIWSCSGSPAEYRWLVTSLILICHESQCGFHL